MTEGEILCGKVITVVEINCSGVKE